MYWRQTSICAFALTSRVFFPFQGLLCLEHQRGALGVRPIAGVREAKNRYFIGQIGRDRRHSLVSEAQARKPGEPSAIYLNGARASVPRIRSRWRRMSHLSEFRQRMIFASPGAVR